uniref:Uncharacterized protein n=1 Tax=Streptomyces sp. NBC_01401 TaxID=2903854 RepID=A0AAU3GN38_9ACTN
MRSPEFATVWADHRIQACDTTVTTHAVAPREAAQPQHDAEPHTTG